MASVGISFTIASMPSARIATKYNDWIRFRALLLSVFVSTVPAVAQNPATVVLEWQGPGGCPSRAEMLEQILSTIGTTRIGSEPVRARVAIEGNFDGFRANVALSASGQTVFRNISSTTCRGVSDAVALIVALAVNPDAVRAESAVNTKGTRAEPAVNPDAARAKPTVRTPRAAAPPNDGYAKPTAQAPQSAPSPYDGRTNQKTNPYDLHGVVAAAGVMDLRTLPSTTFGGELSLGLGSHPWYLEATAGLLASRSARLPSRPLEGADFSQLRIGGRGCYELGRASIQVGPCLGLNAERIRAQGFGADQRWPVDGWLGNLAVGVRVTSNLGAGLRVRLQAEQISAFNRLYFLIDNGGTVFVTPRSAFRSSLGLELHF